MSVTETGPPQMGIQSPIQERIYRRLLLVGPGAASFYRDACRLMALDQPLEATTHVVSHLLREIESAMRGVLAPIAEVSHSQITPSQDGEAVPHRPPRRKVKGDGTEKHARQIRLILKALSIRDDEPVGLGWLQLAGEENSYALHSRAHRDSLSEPRPLDADFRQFWDQIQAILDRVLDRFEARYLDCVNIVDELLRTEVPTCADAKALRQQVPNNPKLLSHFLQRAGPAWVGPLRDEGFFSRISWPWSEYLSSVAHSGDRAAQERVTEIVLNGKDIEDHVVAYDLASAALAVPPDLAAGLAANESAWIARQQRLDGLLPDKLGALISHLAKGGQHDTALQIARVVLAVLPDEKPISLPHPRGRMSDWDYQQILEKNVPDLVRTAPEPGLKLLSELLDTAVRSSFRKEAQYEPPEDISAAWRHAVEYSAQDLSPTSIQGVRGLLVSALRDSAERVVGDELLPIADVVQVVEAYRWLIFQRIALHILRRFAEAARHLVVERLLDADRFTSPYDTRLLHEYALLLREQFGHLTPEQQATILGWIDHGPDLERTKTRYEENIGQPFTSERADLYRKHWQLNRLALICDNLQADWRVRYDQLVRELGQPDHAEFQSWSSGVETGPTSSITADEISSLRVEEVVARIAQFHADWKPNYSISAPTPEGLGRELAAAVTKSP